jgi:ribosome assembly protein YihI (activator of Der GTPase)
LRSYFDVSTKVPLSRHVRKDNTSEYFPSQQVRQTTAEEGISELKVQAYLAALLELLDNMEALTAHARVLLEGLDVRVLELIDEVTPI